MTTIEALIMVFIMLVSCSRVETLTGSIDVVIEEQCTDTEAEEKPTEKAKMVGKLTAGMTEIVRSKNGGIAYRCGERLSDDEQWKYFSVIAWRIIEEMESTGLDVDPWGILGTMFNESGFDQCALGFHPRKEAYRLGHIKQRKTSISHTRYEVLSYINRPEIKRKYTLTGFDLGLCQVLSRFYRETPYYNMLTVVGGVRICVLEMQSRARRNHTREPWLYWRGSRTPWYGAKIKRWVRLMKK